MKLAKAGLGMFILAGSFLVFSSGVFGQTAGSAIKGGKKFKQTVATLVSPKEPDWKIVKAESTETVLEKVAGDKKFRAFVKTAKIPVYESNKELLMNLEKLKMSEVDEANRDSVHYNYSGYKSTQCLQYDGIFHAPNTGYKHFNMSGYICRHPDDKSVIIQFEFANYSNDRGFLETETESSIAFFESVEFRKLR